VLLADFIFAPNAGRTLLNYFKIFENVLLAELSFVWLALNVPALGGVSEQVPCGSRHPADSAQSIIFINAVYTGPREQGEKYLQPLLQLSPLRHNLTMVPWASINAQSFFAIEAPGFQCPTGSTYNAYGGAVHTFDVPTFHNFYEKYDNLIRSEELAGTVYFIELFPKQAVEKVSRSATAYPWRNITAHL